MGKEARLYDRRGKCKIVLKKVRKEECIKGMEECI